MSALIERIKQDLSSFNPSELKDQAKAIAIALTLPLIFAPWFNLGPDNSANGAQALSFLVLSDAKTAWLRANPLGTFLFLCAVPTTLLLCFVALHRAYHQLPSLKLQAAIILLPLAAMKMAAVPILGNSHLELGIMPVPSWGLTSIMLIHLATIGWDLYLRYAQKGRNHSNQTPQQPLQSNQTNP